jgi:hypothetical protein
MDYNEWLTERILKERLADLRAAAARERLLATLPRRGRRDLSRLRDRLATALRRLADLGRRLGHVPAAGPSRDRGVARPASGESALR